MIFFVCLFKIIILEQLTFCQEVHFIKNCLKKVLWPKWLFCFFQSYIYINGEKNFVCFLISNLQNSIKNQHENNRDKIVDLGLAWKKQNPGNFFAKLPTPTIF